MMALIVLLILGVIVLLERVARKKLSDPRSSQKHKLLDLSEKEKHQPQSLQSPLQSRTNFSKIQALAVLGGFFLALCCCICIGVYLWEVFYGPLGLAPPKLMALVLFNFYMLVVFHSHREMWES